MMSRKSLLILLCLCGCVRYHSMPLDSTKVAERLAPPNMEAVRVQAKEIKHPLLKPIDIDLSEGLTPDGAAVLAVLSNPALDAVRDQRGIAAAQLLQAGILPNPQFSYSLGFPTGGNTQGTVNAYGLGLDWNITSLISHGAKIDAAHAHEASIQLDVAWKEWQVAQAAKLHVYRLVFFEKQLIVAQEEEKGLQENLETVRRATELRDMTVIDLNAAEAALQNIRTSVLSLKQQKEQERLALNESLGFPPAQVITLKHDIEPPSLRSVPSPQDIMEGLEVRRLDLVALKMGYQSQEERLRAAVREQFPNIGIGLTHARDTTNVITTGFSITIALPFFDRNQGNIAIEQASRKQLFDEYVARVFETRAQVVRILADIEAVQQQISVAEGSLPILKNLTQNYHRALLEGNADVLSYYAARDRLVSAELAVLSLKRSLAELHIALELASGEYLGQGEAVGVLK
jgi:outer membrane protein TolC